MANNKAPIASIAFVQSLLLASPPVFAEPLLLRQAVEIAARASPEVGQAKERRQAAEAVRDQARRAWFPQVNLEGTLGYRRLENDARVNLGLSALNEHPLYGSVNVTQPVYDMGRRHFETKAQTANAQALRESENFTEETTAYIVASAYLQVILQERLLDLAKENLAYHDHIAGEMSDGLKSGVMNISDLQQANERVQTARVRLADAETELGIARNAFSALVGSEPEDLELPSASMALPPSLPDAIALVTEADPRIREARSRLASAEAALGRVRRERLPVADVRGSASVGKDFDGYRGQTRDYRVVFNVLWPIFDGGVDLAKIREAEHKAGAARYALDQVRRDSEREVRDAWQRHDNWMQRAAEQERRATIANDVLYSYEAQFKIGRRSLLDMLNAQSAKINALQSAETARIGTLISEYSVLVSMNRLRAALGVADRQGMGDVYGPQ
ncbi:TolC family protein [Novosphingobium mangrovi (ex Huang et al. 2023)]|uniref:TolC family protein n=1 Tax=Novosphingobium mangrovi (ex Huang et al. 2023) TaxID=2976432 RepID=A0ABT2IA77_9SPHN|nr:TolC family protein [Novosphingobium mangrovi (ex Huang et al. 2023)]MCT2401729.1 TolC family protein [Novosphingobium mangrovi (ex Huang et al. 2023)]